jgi:hypothetical protein
MTVMMLVQFRLPVVWRLEFGISDIRFAPENAVRFVLTAAQARMGGNLAWNGTLIKQRPPVFCPIRPISPTVFQNSRGLHD